ncbi:hypothetical protein [Paenibacillus sp. FSL L8-0638]|uniref:hypothetical protein n=1 Tax=Paenibacillus TaxID=44249 RepID=UPI003158B18D
MSTQPRFAFLDSEGILHLHDEAHAAQHGKHVQTPLIDDESGFPIVEGQGVVTMLVRTRLTLRATSLTVNSSLRRQFSNSSQQSSCNF